MQPPKMKYPREQFVGCAVLFCSQTVQLGSQQSVVVASRPLVLCQSTQWLLFCPVDISSGQTLQKEAATPQLQYTAAQAQHYSSVGRPEGEISILIISSPRTKRNRIISASASKGSPTTTINPTTDCRIAGNPFTSELGHFTVNQVSSLILNRYAIQTQIE